jgi:hypothetical protein
MFAKSFGTNRFTRWRKQIRVTTLAMAVAFLSGGCPGVFYHPEIEPKDFGGPIDNPYFPLTPGTTFVYESATEKGVEEIRVEVTEDTKTILGVVCTVVHDVVTIGGVLAEDTLDWYAQDEEGNVWYFGEYSERYEDGVFVDTEGSWEAGVDGAKPGIAMKAHPREAQRYRQEYYPGVAEDMALVVSLDETVTVPFGTFKNCLKTRDFTPLEPGIAEYKYYAPGIGQVLTEEPDGVLNELVNIESR